LTRNLAPAVMFSTYDVCCIGGIEVIVAFGWI
jgi:hypothetical protein